MAEIVKLTDEHLGDLGRQDMTAESLGDFSFAAIVKGRAVAAGGILPMMWPGRGYCWFISKDVPFREWVGITRAVAEAVRIALDTEYRRVEMYVRKDDPKAQRWAELLGFKLEGLHPMLHSDGADGFTYGRTNQEAAAGQ